MSKLSTVLQGRLRADEEIKWCDNTHVSLKKNVLRLSIIIGGLIVIFPIFYIMLFVIENIIANGVFFQDDKMLPFFLIVAAFLYLPISELRSYLKENKPGEYYAITNQRIIISNQELSNIISIEPETIEIVSIGFIMNNRGSLQYGLHCYEYRDQHPESGTVFAEALILRDIIDPEQARLALTDLYELGIKNKYANKIKFERLIKNHNDNMSSLDPTLLAKIQPFLQQDEHIVWSNKRHRCYEPFIKTLFKLLFIMFWIAVFGINGFLFLLVVTTLYLVFFPEKPNEYYFVTNQRALCVSGDKLWFAFDLKEINLPQVVFNKNCPELASVYFQEIRSKDLTVCPEESEECDSKQIVGFENINEVDNLVSLLKLARYS